MNKERAKYYSREPNHKYMVVNYARNPIIEVRNENNSEITIQDII